MAYRDVRPPQTAVVRDSPFTCRPDVAYGHCAAEAFTGRQWVSKLGLGPPSQTYQSLGTWPSKRVSCHFES
jgi:hypothetical protein